MNTLEYEINRWREYATTMRFARPEDAEKDYLQELLLAELFSGKIGGLLVFRGGTSISKIYGSGRFSEDLDFILSNEIGGQTIITEVTKALARLGTRYPVEYKKEEYRNMLKYLIKIRGPIYSVASNEQAKQTIGIDLNLYERPILEVKDVERLSIYDDARPYLARVLQQKELVADKAKAMLERREPVARDLYDLWFLTKKYRIKLDGLLVAKKMALYGNRNNEMFSKVALAKRIRIIGRIWDKEMKRLMAQPPSYGGVANDIKSIL